MNEFPLYELDWLLLPSCQEFRYLHVAATWEPGIPSLHTYICWWGAESLHDLFHLRRSWGEHWKTGSGWSLKFASLWTHAHKSRLPEFHNVSYWLLAGLWSEDSKSIHAAWLYIKNAACIGFQTIFPKVFNSTILLWNEHHTIILIIFHPILPIF
jgi:hypothetical protein